MAGLRLANVFVEDALGLPEGVFTLAVCTGGLPQPPIFRRLDAEVGYGLMGNAG